MGITVASRVVVTRALSHRRRARQLAGGGPENQVPRVNFEIGAHLKSTRPAEPAKTAAGTDGAAGGGSNQVSEGGSPDGKPNA